MWTVGSCHWDERKSGAGKAKGRFEEDWRSGHFGTVSVWGCGATLKPFQEALEAMLGIVSFSGFQWGRLGGFAWESERSTVGMRTAGRPRGVTTTGGVKGLSWRC